MSKSNEISQKTQGFQFYGVGSMRGKEVEACFKFEYKQHIISVSNRGYAEGGCLNEIMISEVNDNQGIHDYFFKGSVEEAIEAVNFKVEHGFWQI